MTDIAIIGGGTGGCAAALAAWAMGCQVVMTEETDWIGGQLTSQAVPPDENRWIETVGGTARYQEFRHGVRAYYRKYFPLIASSRVDRHLNPGKSWVCGLAYQPDVGHAVLQSMFREALNSGRLQMLLRRRPVSATADRDRITSVCVENLEDGSAEILEASCFLDATEFGDLLELANVEHVVGAESQAETGEPHAEPVADPNLVQALTWCLPVAMDDRDGAQHVIRRPEQYARWRSYAPHAEFPDRRMLSWSVRVGRGREEWLDRRLFDGDRGFRGLWSYRRVVCRDHYDESHRPEEATIINWPQNDYYVENTITASYLERDRIIDDAKQLSLSLLYWLQTEAPRQDGGVGYPELRLRPDLVGTADGLAKAPYVRESRRIVAEFTVLEQHVSSEVRGDLGAEPFPDSVGIGHYGLDIHHCTGGGHNLHLPAEPFQIPLGCLLPIRVENLLPACKNIGITHVTNGCYRLHPVEWNIGEAAGLLAAFSLQKRVTPRDVRLHRDLTEDFQSLLYANGVPTSWPWA